jgi:hypothetical protein
MGWRSETGTQDETLAMNRHFPMLRNACVLRNQGGEVNPRRGKRTVSSVAAGDVDP